MAVARFVVKSGAAHQTFGQGAPAHGLLQPPSQDLFNQIEQAAPIAIGHFQKRAARACVQWQGSARLHFSPLRQKLQLIIGQRL